MAIYHCSVKAISRSQGRSATAAAAYRAAEMIKDRRTGEVHDYSRKGGVEHTELILPYAVKMNREELWNAAEMAERRKDSCVAREYEVALPSELSKDERRELVLSFGKALSERHGVAVDLCLHEPNRSGDERNHHAHILTTTRIMGQEGLEGKAAIEKAGRKRKTDLQQTRALWADLCNLALERAGQAVRVDHRSLMAQGVDRDPTLHMGPAATAMERRGEYTERGDINKKIKEIEEIKSELSVLQKVRNGVSSAYENMKKWRVERKRVQEVEKMKQEQEIKAKKKERELEKQKQLEIKKQKQKQQRAKGRQGPGWSR